MKPFSKIISILFHPVFLYVIGFVFILFAHPYTNSRLSIETKRLTLLVTFINLVILPGMLIFILKRNNLISTYQIEDQKERNITFLIFTLIMGVFVYQINKYSFPYLAINFGISIALNIFILWLINFKFKLSFHSLASSSLIGLVLFVIIIESTNSALIYLLISIVLAGVIGSARLYLSAHKPSEVYLGYGLGATLTFTTLWILNTIA